MPAPRTITYSTTGIVLASIIMIALWHKNSLPLPVLEPAGKNNQETRPLYPGDFVVVNLGAMTIELRHGTSTLNSMSILSVGKPGSYYETIGGTYENDYKIRSHMSTIGHVYMPWSVHVFGNFFIHGVPYYPSGAKVSGEYSGGCIRLSDGDAKRVYDFVQKGTPIIVTERNDSDFAPLASSTEIISSMDMTRFMAATVSLEVLTQDDPIYDSASGAYTTRRKLLPELVIDKNDNVIRTYASARGDQTFLMYMNLKAKALGLTNTSFASPYSPATTSIDDLDRFSDYIQTYKTYLLTLASSTQPVVSR